MGEFPSAELGGGYGQQEMATFCPRADFLQLETRLALLLQFPKTFTSFLSLRVREVLPPQYGNQYGYQYDTDNVKSLAIALN